MFIRIIAAIDSWFCFQIWFSWWFCHVLLKWYCNSLLLLSRLTNVTKKLQKTSLWIWNWISRLISRSETESADFEIVEKWPDNARVLWWPERLRATEYENAVSCLDWKRNGKLNQITCTVPLLEKYFTTHFMTACYRILIDLFSQ